MKQVIEIINQIAATSSSNEKLAILKSHKDNPTLQKVLKYTYDDSLKYGITQDIIQPYITEFYPCEVDIFSFLDKLASSNINESLRVACGKLLGSLTQDVGDLVLKILTKDLRCGISSKTIQKVWKDLIPKWEVQQAYPLLKVKLKPNEWIALSEKLNGGRGSYLNGEMKSRQNKVFNGLDHIINDIKSLHLADLFIDGELVRNNHDNIPDNENFRLSMSILNSDIEDKSELIFRIYDIMPNSEFLQGESKLRYPDRIQQLENLNLLIKEKNLTNIEVLPILYQGTDHSQIDKWLQWADDNGKEGMMLYRDTTYKCKRHNGILKVKSFKHADVLCIGVFQGEGKYKDMLGGITVEYKGYEVGVGSGFLDSQRIHYWNNKEEIIGKVVQVKFKEESSNKDGGLSLQFPIFEIVREDGKEISYN